MAHYVGKVLHIRPSEILDNWGVAELVVAYGEYINEQAAEAYANWRANYRPPKGEPPAPPQVIVKFIGVRDLEEWTE